MEEVDFQIVYSLCKETSSKEEIRTMIWNYLSQYWEDELVNLNIVCNNVIGFLNYGNRGEADATMVAIPSSVLSQTGRSKIYKDSSNWIYIDYSCLKWITKDEREEFMKEFFESIEGKTSIHEILCIIEDTEVEVLVWRNIPVDTKLLGSREYQKVRSSNQKSFLRDLE